MNTKSSCDKMFNVEVLMGMKAKRPIKNCSVMRHKFISAVQILRRLENGANYGHLPLRTLQEIIAF